MTETVTDEKAISKNDQWREQIAEHQRSGMSVRRFCKERGIAEPLFFWLSAGIRRDPQFRLLS